MHMQDLVEIHQSVLIIMSGNEILTSIKDHNSVINLQKSMGNNPKVDLVDINAYAKFCRNPLICTQNIDQGL